MRVFNFHLITDARFRAEKREAERTGHRLALYEFRDADKVIVGGQQVLNGKDIREKLVLMGDGHLIYNNVFNHAEVVGI